MQNQPDATLARMEKDGTGGMGEHLQERSHIVVTRDRRSQIKLFVTRVWAICVSCYGCSIWRPKMALPTALPTGRSTCIAKACSFRIKTYGKYPLGCRHRLRCRQAKRVELLRADNGARSAPLASSKWLCHASHWHASKWQFRPYSWEEEVVTAALHPVQHWATWQQRRTRNWGRQAAPKTGPRYHI